MRSSLSKIAGSVVLAAATLIPGISTSQEPPRVYAQTQTWGLLGAGQTTVYTQTQPGVVYTPKAVLYNDGCCTRPGIGFVPTPAEIVTGRCVQTSVNWDKSILALPGRGLAELGRGINQLGKALTPHGVSDRTRCITRPYCGSVQYDPCTQYRGQEPQRYLAPTPVQPEIQQPGDSVLIQPPASKTAPKIPAQQLVPPVPANDTAPGPAPKVLPLLPVPSDEATPRPAPTLSPPDRKVAYRPSRY